MDNPNIEQNSENSTIKPNLASAKVLLSVVEKEYGYEFDRGKDLQTRTGMFLAFAGALLVFVVSNIKLTNIKSVQVVYVSQILPYLFLMLSLAFLLMSLLFAIFCFVQVVYTKTYSRLSLEFFSEQNLYNNATLPEEEVLLSFTSIYKHCIDDYTLVNNRKVVWYKRGIHSVLASLVLICVTYLALLYIS